MLRILTAAALLLTAPALAQAPQAEWKGENLQYFPKDISRATLTQRMREFSFALNVRCQYCHAGGDGVSLQGVSFASDEKPAKRCRRSRRSWAAINSSGSIGPRSSGSIAWPRCFPRRTATSPCSCATARGCR